jgi:hypothetical protein
LQAIIQKCALIPDHVKFAATMRGGVTSSAPAITETSSTSWVACLFVACLFVCI